MKTLERFPHARDDAHPVFFIEDVESAWWCTPADAAALVACGFAVEVPGLPQPTVALTPAMDVACAAISAVAPCGSPLLVVMKAAEEYAAQQAARKEVHDA